MEQSVDVAPYSCMCTCAHLGFCQDCLCIKTCCRQQRLDLWWTVLGAQLQLGVQGILVLDARENGPAASAGVQGTKRDPSSGRLILGDVITGFNNNRVRRAPAWPPLPAYANVPPWWGHTFGVPCPPVACWHARCASIPVNKRNKSQINSMSRGMGRLAVRHQISQRL